ncbi:hypothetical protein ES707_11744 [subsurface metagenome]
MTEYSRFFGSEVEGEPKYTQPQLAEVLKHIFSNGVFSDIENELEIVEHDPPALAVYEKTGKGWIEGYWYHNKTTPLVKSLAAADPVYPRIDRIILRLYTTDPFKISCEVLEGTPAAEPTPPDLTQNASTWEISLVQVYIAAEATSVSNANITDEREYAGVPNGVYLTLVQTLTNKRITKRVVSIASSPTPTPNGDITDIYKITALAEAATFGAPTGTPTDNQTLVIKIKDNGTIRALSWNAIYVGIGVDLPDTTIAGKLTMVGFMYNSDTSKWECPNAVAQEE